MSYKLGKNVTIGDGTSIGDFSTIGDNCVIGKDVIISENVIICAETVIEDNVFIGPAVVFFDDNYMKQNTSPKFPPMVKKNARIGGNSSVCQGVVIGENAMVGIGSLVIFNVPDKEMWHGRPAKRVRSVPDSEVV